MDRIKNESKAIKDPEGVTCCFLISGLNNNIFNIIVWGKKSVRSFLNPPSLFVRTVGPSKSEGNPAQLGWIRNLLRTIQLKLYGPYKFTHKKS
uniref:Uncharacterized protein n=1 Tax=Rhizoctonia solani TaxID=456999 RepID=N0A375_9AGAM|nr:hypothetical protein RSOL_m00970 [Rhizoctonia solani]AGK45413.1 hypothetical protein RSOL_m00970 [Rhizoctonia solani]